MKFKLKSYDVDKLNTDDYDLEKTPDTLTVIINKVYNDNGFVKIDAQVDNINVTKFKVVYYTNDGFIMEGTDNSDIFENTIYNIRVRF